MNVLELWGYGLLAAVLAFSLCFSLAKAIKNMAVVDVLWGYGVGLISTFYYLLSQGAGWPVRRSLILAITVLISLRLGTHIFRRFVQHHPHEDPRYAYMRQLWPQRWHNWFYFGAYLLQGSLMGALSFPILLAYFIERPALYPVEWAGLAVLVIAWLGEGLADWQLSRCLARNKDNPKALCQDGLWRYSRHPNYFFQWLQWVGFALLAQPHPYGLWAWLAPALMFHFLWNVTGIAISEKLATDKRGEAYRQYQQSTSPFFPWFPKKQAG